MISKDDINDYEKLKSALLKRYRLTADGFRNGIPIPTGNPMGIPWEWELMTQLGMGMGRNGNHPVWEWEWPLFPWE